MELARMRPLLAHPHLEKGRGLSRALLRSVRFRDRTKTDPRGNAIFPHADKDGPCGYEIKSAGFTGFSPGGDKELWFSATANEDRVLVIAESGIDALSHAALFPRAHARYTSIAGAMNPRQPDLIASAIEKMGQGARIVLAMDNDAPGRDLAERIAAIARKMGRDDHTILPHLPEGEGMDWNDCLRAVRTIATPPSVGEV